MNLGKDFQAYAKDKMRVSDNQLNQYGTIQSEVYDSMTPYILEEREMRVTQMDIFSRLMRERILWVSGPVNQYMSDVVKAQLLYLENVSDEDITMYIDTPGGSVINGLSMINTMGLVKPEIKTINNGMCASMGSVLLGAGTKGKRFMLPDAMVMLHQVSSGMEGNVQDMRISMKLSEKFNDRLFELLGGFCGKDPKEVLKDSERDLWLDAKEAKNYGLIDEIIGE
jgi:ATP-dependent Clp protease protease subunit